MVLQPTCTSDHTRARPEQLKAGQPDKTRQNSQQNRQPALEVLDQRRLKARNRPIRETGRTGQPWLEQPRDEM